MSDNIWRFLSAESFPRARYQPLITDINTNVLSLFRGTYKLDVFFFFFSCDENAQLVHSAEKERNDGLINIENHQRAIRVANEKDE